MNTKPRHFIFAAFATTLFFACAPLANPQGNGPDRTISVTGTALTRTIPDTVVWQVHTTSTHLNIVEAKNISDVQMQAILKTVRDLGVEAKDVQTGYLEVRKEYQRDNYGTPAIFKHFRVTRQLTIKERDTSKFDKFLTGLVKSADVEVSYELTTSRLQDIRAETRLKAVTTAKDKAAAMAGALDASLGDVLKIHEKVDHGYGGMSNLANEIQLEKLEDSEEVDESTFAPGAIGVKVAVDAVFELQ